MEKASLKSVTSPPAEAMGFETNVPSSSEPVRDNKAADISSEIEANEGDAKPSSADRTLTDGPVETPVVSDQESTGDSAKRTDEEPRNASAELSGDEGVDRGDIPQEPAAVPNSIWDLTKSAQASQKKADAAADSLRMVLMDEHEQEYFPEFEEGATLSDDLGDDAFFSGDDAFSEPIQDDFYMGDEDAEGEEESTGSSPVLAMVMVASSSCLDAAGSYSRIT